MEPKIIRRLGVTDYLSCIYNDPAERSSIDVYVGYHASQLRDKDNRATNIHPPEHCLPGSGWDIVDSQVVPFRSGNVDGEAKRFVIARGDQRQLVYFWYETQGRVIARNHEVIFYKFWDRARRGRSDSALVRLTVPIERNQAEKRPRRRSTRSRATSRRSSRATFRADSGPHLPIAVRPATASSGCTSSSSRTTSRPR